MKTIHRAASQAKRRWQASNTACQETIDANSDQCPVHAIQMINKVRKAFELLKNGHGEADHFNEVSSAFVIGFVRAEEIDPFLAETMNAGVEAMKICDRIHMKHGRYGFHGPDLDNVGDAVAVYAEIVNKSKPIQMEHAAKEAARRILRTMQAQGVVS